jgi:hypothetical protein
MSSVAYDTIESYRIIATKSAIRLWMNAKIRPSRHVGINDLLRIASEYTGEIYPINNGGYQKAIDDLEEMIEGRERIIEDGQWL